MLVNCQELNSENITQANEILSEVAADSGGLYFTTDELEKNNNKKYFIELLVRNSYLIDVQGTKPKIVASYCASQLYKRIDKKTLDKNYAFKIVLISNDNQETFFFEKQEIKKVNEALNSIDKYINLVIANNLSEANSMLKIDEHKNFNLTVTNKISERIKDLKINSYNYYDDFSYTTKNDCWVVNNLISLNDKLIISLQFIIQKEEPEKIIYVKINQ